MDKKNISSEIISAKTSSAFERWHLPSFDEEDAAEKESETVEEEADQVIIEEVELEEVQPLTIEEVETVRQDAYNEGFAAGEKEGFHSGQLRAHKETEAAMAPRLQALEQIMQQLFEPIAQQDQALEKTMLELVQLISQQVIQRELELDSSQISQVLRDALKLLADEGEQVRVYLNPQDFDQVKALRERNEESWRIVEDENLAPGGCRVEAAQTRIDATIETRLKTLTQQLLEQQRTLQAEPISADDIQDFDLQAAPIAAEMPEELEETEVPEELQANEVDAMDEADEPDENLGEVEPEVAVIEEENQI